MRELIKLSWRPLSVVAFMLLPLLTCGCAASSYMGIGFAPGAADPALQQLALRARGGDKQAQLELGRRFETGESVPTNLVRARQLYRAAAMPKGGTQMLHVPAAKNGGFVVIPVFTGPHREGVKEARERLADLDGEHVLDPVDKRHTLRGMVQFVGPSDICTTKAEAIQTFAKLAIGDCRATAYRLIDTQGHTFDLVDLVLITTDRDATVDLHIPFGLIDTAETELFSEGNRPVHGTVTLSLVPTSHGDINIIRSFKRGH